MSLDLFIFCASLTRLRPSYYSYTSHSNVSGDQSNHSGQQEHLLNKHNWPAASIYRKHVTRTPSIQACSNKATQRWRHLSISWESQIGVSDIQMVLPKGERNQVTTGVERLHVRQEALNIPLYVSVCLASCASQLNQSQLTVPVEPWHRRCSEMAERVWVSHPQKRRHDLSYS